MFISVLVSRYEPHSFILIKMTSISQEVSKSASRSRAKEYRTGTPRPSIDSRITRAAETQSEYKHLARILRPPSSDEVRQVCTVWGSHFSLPWRICKVNLGALFSLFCSLKHQFQMGQKMNDYTRRAKLTVWMQSTPKVAWHSILFGNWLGTQKVRQLTVLPICYWQVEGPNKLRTLRPSRKSFR